MAKKRLTADDVRAQIRASIGYGTAQDFALAIGVSPQYLCDVLLGRKEPGDKILRGIGLVRVVEYEPIREGQKQ